MAKQRRYPQKGPIMKKLLTISFISATVLAGQVMAAPNTNGEMPEYPANVMVKSNAPAKTRAEVVAELNAAPIRGTELGEMPDYPQGYQTQVAGPTKTRAQVLAELNATPVTGNELGEMPDYPAAGF